MGTEVGDSMMLSDVLAKPAPWLARTELSDTAGQGADLSEDSLSDVVLCSAAMLARNVADVPFPRSAKAVDREDVWEQVSRASSCTRLFKDGWASPLAELHGLERQVTPNHP